MNKRFLVLMILSLTVFSMTGCGKILKAMDNYQKKENAKETLLNDMQNTPGLEIYGANNGLDLNDAINDALEASGETMIDGEGELKFDIPKGFIYDESIFCYKTPDSLVSFNYITVPQDGTFAYYTKEIAEMQAEQEFSSLFGEDVDVTIESWEYITVDGYDAIRYEMRYEVLDTGILQTQIIINGKSKFHTFSYSQNTKSTIYKDVMLEVEKSFRFE